MNKKCTKCDIVEGEPWKPTGTDCDAGKHQWADEKECLEEKIRNICRCPGMSDTSCPCQPLRDKLMNSVFGSKDDKRPFWMDKLDLVLLGIDTDQCSSNDGWWETSGGAEFGAGKKLEVIRLIHSVVSESLRMASERVRGMKLGPLVGKYGQSKDSYNEALDKAAESIIKG